MKGYVIIRQFPWLQSADEQEELRDPSDKMSESAESGEQKKEELGDHNEPLAKGETTARNISESSDKLSVFYMQSISCQSHKLKSYSYSCCSKLILVRYNK